MHLYYIVSLLSFLVEGDFTRPHAAFWWISLTENSSPHLVIWGTSSQKPVPFCSYSLNASSQIAYLDFILEDACVSEAIYIREVYVCEWMCLSVCISVWKCSFGAYRLLIGVIPQDSHSSYLLGLLIKAGWPVSPRESPPYAPPLKTKGIFKCIIWGMRKSENSLRKSLIPHFSSPSPAVFYIPLQQTASVYLTHGLASYALIKKGRTNF